MVQTPTKRQSFWDWIRNQEQIICSLPEAYFKYTDTNRLKEKGWEKVFLANISQNKAALSILISNNIDFREKNITRDKKGHYKMIMGLINQEAIWKKWENSLKYTYYKRG